MKIGVIGSGGIGGTVGTLWAKAGHEVLFSSRHPERLSSLVAEAGNTAQAGTIAQAASFADVIFLAVYYWTTDEALAAAQSLEGKIIIDATNPYIQTEAGQIQRLPNTSSGLELAQKAPQAKVIKAYNTLPTATFANNIIALNRMSCSTVVMMVTPKRSLLNSLWIAVLSELIWACSTM